MSVIHGVNYGTPTLDLNFAKNKSLIDTVSGLNLVTFSRASTGTYVGADGLIKNAVANEPRFDHNPVTGESLGLLIEEARTNLTPNSMPTTAGGSGGGLTNTLVTNLPGIFSTGRRLTSSGGNDVRIAIEGTTALSDTVTYAFSFFARLGTQGNSIFVRRGTSSFTTWNLSTGTVTRNDFGTAQIVNYGNGWYKCSAAMLGTSGGSFLMGLGNDLSAASGDNIIIAGVQTEAGTFPTSYIPTTGSTVTRSADDASITGSNFSSWYNQSEGSMFWEGIFDSYGNSGSNDALFSINDGTAGNNRFSIRPRNLLASFNGSLMFQSWDWGYTLQNNTKMKGVFAIKSGDYALVTSGIVRNTSTNSSVPQQNTISSLNAYEGGPVTGVIHHQRISYYPSRLQNYQLQQLTK